MQNKEQKAGTAADKCTAANYIPSASLEQNGVLCAVTVWQIFKIWLEKFACHHQWYLHHECDVYNSSGKSRIGFEQTLICKRCGKIKKLML